LTVAVDLWRELQLAMFAAVSGEWWVHALVLAYYYSLCLTYGFGTLIVARNTTREFERHSEGLDRLRVEFMTSCFFGWSDHHGTLLERHLAKDVSLQVKEVGLMPLFFGAARSWTIPLGSLQEERAILVFKLWACHPLLHNSGYQCSFGRLSLQTILTNQ
jgi:hypothetical protein